MKSLPLFFGIITYLFIIISLTVWLTKYHRYNYHVNDPKEQSGKIEGPNKNDSFNPETKDSQVATSGKSTSKR